MGKQKKALQPLGLILAGGQSKRLFPVKTPKPLLKVRGKFLVQEALERLHGFDVYIVTNAEIAAEIKSAFRKAKLKIPQFIIEPVGRDTAAAVGFGIREASKNKSHSWVAILSADTFMPETKNFKNYLKAVEASILKFPHSLFVGGSRSATKSESSHSQFGWILENSDQSNELSHAVSKFVEKPQGEVLNALRSQGALINAGMFFGKSDVFLKAYERFYPEILTATKSTYKNLQRQPVDKAIFEKFDSVRVVPLDLRWEDLGTWEDWFQHMGEGEGVRRKSNRVFISSANLEVHAYGVSDLAIVESAGRLLVMPLSEARNLKNYLED